MAILNLGKKNKKTSVKTEKVSKKELSVLPISNVSTKDGGKNVIVRPHLTEKAYGLQVDRVYVFEVYPDATKNEVLKSIKAIYNVVPKKIRIAKIKSKAVLWKGRPGRTSGGKKAYVYLNEGDKIELA